MITFLAPFNVSSRNESTRRTQDTRKIRAAMPNICQARKQHGPSTWTDSPLDAPSSTSSPTSTDSESICVIYAAANFITRAYGHKIYHHTIALFIMSFQPTQSPAQQSLTIKSSHILGVYSVKQSKEWLHVSKQQRSFRIEPWPVVLRMPSIDVDHSSYPYEKCTHQACQGVRPGRVCPHHWAPCQQSATTDIARGHEPNTNRLCWCR